MPRLRAAQRRAVLDLLHVPVLADDLGRRFAAHGHQLWLVGGSVRDALLQRHVVGDLDFASDALPERVLEIVDGWATATWDTGVAFGTVGVQHGPSRCEITTFRAEAYDADSRKPDVAYGTSIDADLSRRDFTVNAMAVSLPAHEFVDPHGGVQDLAGKLLRTPGSPEASFTDDPLRMLRAARFTAQLGFRCDDAVVTAMTAMASRLAIVSAERIQGELSKLMLAPNPVAGLELLVDTELAEFVLPELPAMRLEMDPIHTHKDVYLHSLAVLENAIALEGGEPDLVLRLAALLHDIGKPKTRSFDAGTVSFHHHEVVGAKMSRVRLRALRYPKQVVDDVSRLVELHLRFHTFRMGWTDSAVRRYVTDAGPLLERLHALTRSDCTTRNARKVAELATRYDELERRIAELSAQEELRAIRPDLDGTQIMAILDIPPGPLVGRAYQHLLDLRMERGPLSAQDAEHELRAWAAREQT